MPRSFQDIIDHADELAGIFEAYEPGSDDDVTTPAMLVRRAAWKRAQAERDIVEAVVEAREEGVPWTKIGEALGTSAQAAQKRYGGVVVETYRSSPAKSKKSVAKKAGKKPVEKVAAPAKRPAKRTPGRSTDVGIAAKGTAPGPSGTRRRSP